MNGSPSSMRVGPKTRKDALGVPVPPMKSLRSRGVSPVDAGLQVTGPCHELRAGARPTRRLLITRLLRHASLAVLGLAGGAAALKRRRLLREGKCLNLGICRGCAIFDDCGLPRALSTRSVLARGS
jgi:hypothetical protein